MLTRWRARIGLLLLGIATAARAQTPQPARDRRTAPSKTWAAVSAGATHTCALDDAGRAFCWGEITWRTLRVDDTVSARRPIAVATEYRFRSIAAGSGQTCALTRESGRVCWGESEPGNLPRLGADTLRFDTISIRGNACAVGVDRSGYCWGANHAGQLGTGSTVPARAPTPQRVGGDRQWRDIQPFSGHACGLTTEGEALCWGRDFQGRLGTGALGGSSLPVPVAGSLRFKGVTVGAEHSCGLTLEGRAWCWGANPHGALGAGAPGSSAGVPQQVAGTLEFRQLAAGVGFTCGLAVDGAAWCWGFNESGTLGTGTRRHSALPVRVAGRLKFASVSAGAQHVCAIAEGGALYCWGDNSDSQLGIARAQSCRVEVAPRTYEPRACATAPTRVEDPPRPADSVAPRPR